MPKTILGTFLQSEAEKQFGRNEYVIQQATILKYFENQKTINNMSDRVVVTMKKS